MQRAANLLGSYKWFPKPSDNPIRYSQRTKAVLKKNLRTKLDHFANFGNCQKHSFQSFQSAPVDSCLCGFCRRKREYNAAQLSGLVFMLYIYGPKELPQICHKRVLAGFGRAYLALPSDAHSHFNASARHLRPQYFFRDLILFHGPFSLFQLSTKRYIYTWPEQRNVDCPPILSLIE